MPKLDARMLFRDAYTATAAPKLVQAPPLAAFMADGRGDPNTAPDFQAAAEMLYTLSYTLKFERKKADPEQDYAVMPLEGLWWAEDLEDFLNLNKANWLWTVLIVQPPRLSQDEFAALCERAAAKKDLPFERVRLAELDEGLCAQVMHVGPFAEEGPVIQRLHGFIAAQGHAPVGKHHEIYLSDPRRVPEEKWKTILRQPCR